MRRDFYRAFLQRGQPANAKNLKTLLQLRADYAEILGYPNWAAYMAEDKMVKTAERIDAFIARIARVTRPRNDRDLTELLARKKKDDPNTTGVQVWDRLYYVQKVRKEKYGFDTQSVRPYFEFSRVTRGIMDLYSELFGVRFVEDETAHVWHPSVRAYVLYEGEKLAGRFFLDMHPRDGKYGHAAAFPIRLGLSDAELPVVSLVCNFPDPARGPALLEHRQVVTYLAGINTEWDFVEAPSQLLEEWTWDPAVLQRFARHIETDEPIPTDLVRRMKASSEFGKGIDVMRQIYYAALSFYLHTAEPKELDLLNLQRQLIRRYSPYPYVEDTHSYASFGHLTGYSSMYYTYQWSLTLAKDLFTRFDAEGLLDRTVATQYVDQVLKPGGSKDANELMRTFLGREPSLEAYERWLSEDADP